MSENTLHFIYFEPGQTDGDILQYNNTTLHWELVNFKLSISSPTNGQLLVYNATTESWENSGINVIASGDDLGDHKATIQLDMNGKNIINLASSRNGSAYISDAVNRGELDTKSDIGHNHDSIYYTETEIDALLNSKLDNTAAVTQMLDLSDVNNSLSPSNNHVLYHNGVEWTSVDASTLISLPPISIKNLTDVDSLMTPSIGQVLTWTGSEWKGQTVTGISNTLAGLIDVYSSMAPNDGEVLTYVSSTNQWESKVVSSISGATTLPDLTDVNSTIAPNVQDALRWTGTEWDAQPINAQTNIVVTQPSKFIPAGSYIPLNTIPGCTSWYRADQGVTYDANNKVSQWNDISGNDNHLTQSTGDKQPTFLSSSIPEKQSIFFHFSNLHNAAYFPQTGNGSRTVVIVTAFNSFSHKENDRPHRCAYSYGSASYKGRDAIYTRLYDNPTWGFSSYGKPERSSIFELDSNNTQIMIARYDGTNFDIWVNGLKERLFPSPYISQDNSGPLNTGATEGLNIGTDLGGSAGNNPISTAFAEIAFWNRDLTDIEIIDIIKGMSARYGVLTPQSDTTASQTIIPLNGYSSDAAAGAAGVKSGEMYKTLSHLSLPDNVVMVKI